MGQRGDFAKRLLRRAADAVTHLPSLEPDCSNCAALCCVVFAFDRSESFGIDKGAGEVCPNLAKDNGCRIFQDRAKVGFQGCITYTCHGAGQRVTQDTFGGRDWRSEPPLVHRMGASLSVLRRIHEQLVLLQAASKLPLGNEHREQLDRLIEKLNPQEGWSEEMLAVYPVDRVCDDVGRFLITLRGYV